MAQTEKQVVITQYGNSIALSPDGWSALPDRLLRVLVPELMYQKRIFLHGADRIQEDGSIRKVDFEPRLVCNLDDRGRLHTNAGFLTRIQRLLHKAGYTGVLDRRPVPTSRPEAFQFHKERIRDFFTYRPRQEECLDALLGSERGIVKAPTAFGKSTLMRMVRLAAPKAKIDVIVPRLDLVRKTVRSLRELCPCGQVGDGVNKPGLWLTVYSADSLHKSPCDADLVLCDEIHELVTEQRSTQLRRYRFGRMLGFSASPQGRSDGTDIRLEALFGPIIFELSYPEAVTLGLVVPVEVHWLDVVMDYNPCQSQTNDVCKKRYGLWRNYTRNEVIAKKVLTFGDAQVLILVETVEHAVYLRQFLPHYQLVYADLEDKALDKYQAQGLLPANWTPMTRARRDQLRQDYEKGLIRHAIATGMWSVGVDFTGLEVLVRADGGQSEIYSVQGPGRVTRINHELGKKVGVVVQPKDQFDPGYCNRAKSCRRHYESLGWHNRDNPE